ncbi:hypothetical protein FACS1894189_8110 [Planctomycetales bacterium]|nr:hypothetical protein FACS1894189_8110 [Planctomycetales bacterium]
MQFSILNSQFSINIDSVVNQILDDLTTKPVMRAETLDGIYLDSRVVSLAEINERLGTSKKLYISPKSILTPSAKDEIRKRKIEVAVKLPSTNAASCSEIWIAVHKPAVLLPSVLIRLKKEFNLIQNSFDTLTELISEAKKQLSNENTHGIALTKQSASALCSASRSGVLRPILGIDPKQTAEDAAEVDANFLIIHPQRTPESKFYDLIRRFSVR